MEDLVMYFITCFSRFELNERLNIADIGSSRTFGYYKDKDEAIEAVKKNLCDIQERIYKYSVIEHITEGIYNIADERLFFEWNDEKKEFELIEPLIDRGGNYAFG